MSIPALEYRPIETVAKKWECTVFEVLQYSVSCGLPIYAYIRPSKVLKIKKGCIGFGRYPSGSFTDDVIGELESIGYEKIGKELIEKLMVQELVLVGKLYSDFNEFDRCIYPLIDILRTATI
jgi:hypothetical protein